MFSNIPQSLFCQIYENKFLFNLNETLIPIIKKIEKNIVFLGEICYINWGTRSIPQSKFHLDKKINDNCKPLIVGKNVERYKLTYNGLWLFYDAKNLYNPLFPELFENEKIIIRDISGKKGIMAVYDNYGYYTSHTTSCCLLKHKLKEILDLGENANLSKNFDLKYILSIMNSKMIEFYFKKMISSGIHVYLNDLRLLPIYPANKRQQKILIEKVDKLLKLNKNLIKETEFFRKWLGRIFCLEKFSKKLNNFYELSYETFLKELKSKVTVSNETTLKQKFEDSLSIINPIIREIKEIDKEIDSLVYDLYGLTDEEIEIIEKSIE